jgi:hypothetical protein
MDFNLSLDRIRVIADVMRTAGFRFLLEALEAQGDDLLAQVLTAGNRKEERMLLDQLRAYARVVETIKSIGEQASMERPIDELDPFDAAETLKRATGVSR